MTAARFDRPGRATLVFHKAGGKWLCVHSHMSLNKGVPQDSYGEPSGAIRPGLTRPGAARPRFGRTDDQRGDVP